MNEKAPQQESSNRTDSQERLLYSENYRTYERLKLQFDVRGAGASWYRPLLRQGIDFGRVFNYLSTHKESAEKFRDHMHHIVKAQLSFQRHLATVEQRVAQGSLEISIPKRYVESLEEAGNRLKKLQDRYTKGKSNNGKTLSQGDLGKMDDEAARTFNEVWQEAEKTIRTAWPHDEITDEEQKSAAKPQPEHWGPQNGEAEGSNESKESSAAGAGGSHGPDDPESGSTGSGKPEEPKSPEFISDFEFHPEMLKTAEGRTKVFKEMVEMFNYVRKKRDALGFGSEVDGEGNWSKPRRNVKNDEFDGFLPFRTQYFKLRKLLHELSERSVSRNAEGKITQIEDIALTNEEADAFTKQFAFFKQYFGRTEKFGGAEHEGPSPKPEGEPEPEPEPDPEPAPAPDPEPEPAPEPPPSPEKKTYEERAESRRKWQQSKKLYEEAYAEYVGQRKGLAEQLKGLFRNEEKPEKLRILEGEYQDARRAYALSLNSALTDRFAQGTAREKKEAIEGPEGINAALANRFVLRAAQDKLALERERIPQGRAKKVFDDMQAFFKKNGKIIKVAGYVTAAGIGLTVGGFGYALTALAGKAATAKFVGTASAASALAANFGYDLVFLNTAQKERDRSAQRARYAYSEDRLDALENEYLNRYRTYENTVRNKRYVVAGAAIAGGVAAGIAAGNLDAGEIADAVPNLDEEAAPAAPPVHESAPEMPPQTQEAPILQPQQPKPVEPIEPLTEEELQMSEEKIQNEPKDEAFKNPEHIETEPEVVTTHPFEEIDETPYEHGYDGGFPEEETSEFELEPVLHTFEAGDRVDTVSEALYESWKSDPSVLSEHMTQKEFLADMYAAIAEIEKYPNTHATLLEQMGITSGDLDKVQVGQTIDMRPFFEYLNNNR